MNSHRIALFTYNGIEQFSQKNMQLFMSYIGKHRK